MFNKVHHLCFAIYDIDKAISLMGNIYGVKTDRRVKIYDRDIEAVLFKVGETWIEVISPLSEESNLKKYLDEMGEGFHHTAYEVDSLEEAKKALPQGAIIKERNSNVGNWTVADLSKEYSLGVSFQLVESD